MKRIMSKEKHLNSFDTIENMIDTLISKAMRKRSIDELIQMYGETIDSIILDSIKSENLKYIGGNLTSTYMGEYLNINVECYFQDINGRWIKKEAENNIDICKIKKETFDEKQMKFEIEHP